MGFWLTVRVALRALAKNKMRAALTVLGVVIGIAAVTTMVSLGQSATQLVQSEFSSLGTNVLVVFPQATRRRGALRNLAITLTADDCDAIADEAESVIAATPIVGAGGAQVIYGHTNINPRDLIGVGADYLAVRNWPLRHGGFFSSREIDSGAKVCVIGHSIVVKLFQTADPLGAKIRIRNTPFEVIGVLETKGANIVGEDQDDIILMPYTTVRKRLQGSDFSNVDVILASASSAATMTSAQQEISQLLLERHRIRPGDAPDFNVQNMSEIAAQFAVITGILTLMLAMIACISLVVGGVGIMNIMLVSVTERTREIGIRMAIGARSSAVRSQFLIESIVLSLTGGFIGIVLGVILSLAIPKLLGWPTLISSLAIAGSVVFSAAVGIFFGYYPARKAASLDPIEALRYE